MSATHDEFRAGSGRCFCAEIGQRAAFWRRHRRIDRAVVQRRSVQGYPRADGAEKRARAGIADLRCRLDATKHFVDPWVMLTTPRGQYCPIAAGAKTAASELEACVINQEPQLQGGAASMAAYRISRNYRDVSVARICVGTDKIRLEVAAREFNQEGEQRRP